MKCKKCDCKDFNCDNCGEHHKTASVSDSPEFAGYGAWVDATQELPNHRPVLVAYRFGVMEANFMGAKFYVPRLSPAEEVPDVTHWMELPKAP